MARVSQAHLDARRRQILDGARRAFLRNGFHAASMQDVLKETGLSAGAVYRYFGSKEEIVAAVAGEALQTVLSSFDFAGAAEVPLAPDELFAEVFGRVEKAIGAGEDSRELPRLLVQVWAEALRSPQLAEVVAEAYGQLRFQWCRLVDTYKEHGWVDREVDTEHVARTLIGAVQGYFVQQALFGGMTKDDFREGLRGLVSMALPREGVEVTPREH
ncbi:TetR/AcrR family transcriptional regulator [Streptomyces sp. NPDC048172]|uniref:TetR/AcrR family transcriptional regulator n=1 Tax=Streptomyces sp. NPDC048172 TaxID=3365505 RepID=UPI003721E979